jgi:regulator of sirC expression with transglutaminase-like and TPR domain
VVLLPQAWEERRDRGLLYADLGLDAAAERDLSDYLEHALEASDRSQIAERLAGLRSGSGPARLH